MSLREGSQRGKEKSCTLLFRVIDGGARSALCFLSVTVIVSEGNARKFIRFSKYFFVFFEDGDTMFLFFTISVCYYPQREVRFWFATGGAGFCLSRRLAEKMAPWARYLYTDTPCTCMYVIFTGRRLLTGNWRRPKLEWSVLLG